MTAYRFRKAERLTRKKEIAKLFDRNTQDGAVKAFPFVATWKVETLSVPVPAQILMVASKKRLPRAHQRIRIKRQMREYYRHRKSELYTLLHSYDKQIILALIYTGNADESDPKLVQQFDKAFQRLKSAVEASAQHPLNRPDHPV